MNLHVKKPELEKFIVDQVRAGSFPSGDDVAEEAIARMMQEESLTLTADDISAINESEEQIDRGECVDFDALASEMRKKYCAK
jgi:Arc/MetJ-type ribon-helix-helix transcriptional regulator